MQFQTIFTLLIIILVAVVVIIFFITGFGTMNAPTEELTGETGDKTTEAGDLISGYTPPGG